MPAVRVASWILPALRYAGDWWHEGMTYVQPSLGSIAWWATAWSTATDEDVFAADGELFEGYLRFHAYALRPDGTYVYFGDTTDNKQSVELFSRWLVDMITAGTGSRPGRGLSLAIREYSRPGYDVAGANGWMPAIFHDAAREGEALPLGELPTAAWLGRGTQDVAVLRSGWEPDATYVWIVCGDYMSAHQHDEAGSFQIFRRSILTGPGGYCDAHDKRFLLHVPGTVEIGTDRYVLTNGPGALLAQTILPLGADVVAIDGFRVEGVPHPPTVAGRESGGARLEISPPLEREAVLLLVALRRPRRISRKGAKAQRGREGGL